MGQAPGVQIGVQSGSDWPSGLEFHQIFQFQAVLVMFNQQYLVKKKEQVYKNNYWFYVVKT